MEYLIIKNHTNDQQQSLIISAVVANNKTLKQNFVYYCMIQNIYKTCIDIYININKR